MTEQEMNELNNQVAQLVFPIPDDYPYVTEDEATGWWDNGWWLEGTECTLPLFCVEDDKALLIVHRLTKEGYRMTLYKGEHKWFCTFTSPKGNQASCIEQETLASAVCKAAIRIKEYDND